MPLGEQRGNFLTMEYIVSGPARCGGHLLAGIIMSAVQSVTRTHDPGLTLDDDTNTCLIMIDRRDRFAAIMSNLIATKTGQTTHYNNISIDPFEGDENEFRYYYKQHKAYFNQHDLSRLYHRVDKLYYEDFCNNHEFVYQRLGILKSDNINNGEVYRLLNTPAPYNFKDIIINHAELKNLFNDLENGK